MLASAARSPPAGARVTEPRELPVAFGADLRWNGCSLSSGIFINPNPVPVHEVRALADGYNRKLKGEDTAVAGDKMSALLPEMNIGIAPVPGGAIAGVSGRF